MKKLDFFSLKPLLAAIFLSSSAVAVAQEAIEFDNETSCNFTAVVSYCNRDCGKALCTEQQMKIEIPMGTSSTDLPPGTFLRAMKLMNENYSVTYAGWTCAGGWDVGAFTAGQCCDHRNGVEIEGDGNNNFIGCND